MGDAPSDRRRLVRYDMSDIAEHCAHMTQVELARHYGCAARTIINRLKRLGLTCRKLTHDEWVAMGKANNPGTVKKAPPVKKPKVAKPFVHRAFLTRTPVTTRASGDADMAADFLRKFGPVYRCKEDGRPDFAGNFYRRGSYVLTPSEIIERAKRNGYDPAAWKRVA